MAKRFHFPRVHPGWLAAAAGAALTGWVAWTVFQPVSPRRRRRPVATPDEGALRGFVETLTQEFAPRDGSDGAVLQRAATWLGEELEGAGARVAMPELGGQMVPTVIASIGPGPRPRVIVTARYDAPAGSPGARDAGAVAVLLGLARLLADEPPASAVDLVLLADGSAAVANQAHPASAAATEVSLPAAPPVAGRPGNDHASRFATDQMRRAATAHARALADGDADVAAVLCLETLGCFDDQRGSQRFPGPVPDGILPDRGDFVALIGRFGEGRPVRRLKAALREASSVPVLSINGTAGAGDAGHDEHLAYRRVRFPVVRLTDTGPWRNVRLGTAEDMASSLDFARLADFTGGLAHAIRSLAAR